MSGTYDSARLAAGYAFNRPPVHERILQSIPDIGYAARALDVANSFDVLSAAGSLNYVDLPRSLAEARRVLRADGRALVYDFGEGRHAALQEWTAEFEARCPHPPGWRPLDVRELDWAQAGLRLTSYRDVDMTVPLGLEAYQRYVLSEVNVDSAIRTGLTTEEQIRTWSTEMLTPIFAGKELQLQFRGYAGIAGPAV